MECCANSRQLLASLLWLELRYQLLILEKVKATVEIQKEYKVTAKVPFLNLRSNYSLLIAVCVASRRETLTANS